MRRVFLIILTSFVCACSGGKDASNELWIYTSLYKDTISEITPALEKTFPGVKFNFFQAGSEEIAAKVTAEMLAGGTKADVLISSDRFWYEELAKDGHLHAYASPAAKDVSLMYKHPAGYYTTASFPVMVLCYNGDSVQGESAPKSFKELADGKWKEKITSGSPLASGTNFTTLAVLVEKYGWDYIKNLRKNGMISEGGNSAVLRRIQTAERPVGWVLLENILRFQDKDQRLKVVYPQDGVVLQANVMAITQKNESRELAQKFVDWMFGEAGQNAMIHSYMYSPLPSFPAPRGAPPFAEISKNAYPWTPDFIAGVMAKRNDIKERFSKIMFE